MKPAAFLKKKEIKLYDSIQERDRLEALSEIYAILVALEQLERAYIRDAVNSDAYTPACVKLIAQYKTAMNLLHSPLDLDQFSKEYKMNCPAAIKRLAIGVPASVEHTDKTDNDSAKIQYNVATTVQFFITLMDSLKLNMVAADQIHPLLSELIVSLNKLTHLPPEFEAKLSHFRLITLNKMRADEELNTSQSRQLLFDIENSYNLFTKSLMT
ncbi:ESCRT-1 complex, Vps28 subunit [Rozella allomycis CSF55]|uniref:Vacuolar protein sorting-associated protein 28 n=1 Tax=Rozella allomycis (strain CSF55) TaxID=988480 RepID=A0A075B3Y4_ROZAC|nr:Vacuolar protein sorting-associated, VPS28 domain-containing protein [Rozella allomycis CSF55]RKP20073.1 ESCRT-1 complex, Vps28 subunit [Rozella allomycis CSF55]|eukprot:EPZ35872.1 Vacuolar protein sorting-associated, VPS28 domain-containing protein [Rozella allomycis CSF55]